MAKNTFLDWDTTASNNQDVGGITILGTSAVNNFDDALRTIMAQLRSGVDGEVVYAAKSTNYTATVTDNNAMLRFTAAATLGLNTAASLGSGWHISIIADGGAVTIDPNGSQTINGQTTQVIPNGSTASIICDGTNFFTVQKPMAWEFISYTTVSGTPSTIDFTNLSAYKTLRLTGWVSGSAGAGALYARTSTNNGSSYDAGAADYATQIATVTNATVGNAGVAAATYMQLSSANGISNISFNLLITRFNQASLTQFLSTVYGADNGSSVFVSTGGGQRASTTPRNAFRLFASVGTFNGGELTLEGIR